MDDCCEVNVEDGAQHHGVIRYTLWIVLVINTVMFLAEFSAGLTAHSTSLLADSLDMFGDAVVYALSLYALHRTARWKAGAALVNSLLMAGFGVFILVDVALKIGAGAVPAAPLMGAFGAVALVANLTCAVLLLRFRKGEINLRSTWLCSRNDVLANLGVLLAAALVAYFHSLWPDVAIGLVIAGVFLHSALDVFRDALHQLVGHADPAGASAH